MQYLLQKVPIPGTRDSTLQPEAAGAAEAIEFENWKNQESRERIAVDTAFLEHIQRLDQESLRQCIPVGSIEFVDAVRKRAFGLEPMKPLNVPAWAALEPFWRRRLAVCSGKDAVRQIFEDFEVEELFIKSASRLKAPITGIYQKGQGEDIYKDEPLLLVSTVIRPQSEWRVFVSHGRIRDIRCYSGDLWVVPNRERVEEIAKASARDLPAGTIDIGVLDTWETVIIEIHRFVSCGLYGAEVPLAMYSAGYRSTLGG